MKEQILQLINNHFAKTHGGMSLISLSEELKIGQEELKTHLNALYQEKKIRIRDGINLKLIYPNETTKKA